MGFFARRGSAPLRAKGQAIGWTGQQLQAQASFVACMVRFEILMLSSLAAVPLALTLRKVSSGASTPGS